MIHSFRFYITLTALCCLPVISGDLVVSLKYFDDSSCKDDIYGVGVFPGQCIQTSSGGVWVTCSDSSGLVVTEFINANCTGPSTQLTLSTNTSGCANEGFTSSSYYQTPLSGYKINCYDDEDWTKDNTDYILTRSTMTLQATSALDFTNDVCSQNNASTDMHYCFLNQNDDYCLPTDEGGSSDVSLCKAYPTMYAYADMCMLDNPSSGNSYIYETDNHGVGKLRRYSDTSCISSDTSYAVPYSVCMGCNRFKDLPNNGDSKIHLAGWIVAVIVISVVACCCGGCFLVAMMVYGSAAVVNTICCKRGGNTSSKSLLAHQQNVSPPVSNPASSLSYPQYASDVEILNIQLPANAAPGDILQATKSNGELVQFQIPQGSAPGSVIQIKA